MQTTFIKTFLKMFGEKGIKAIINVVASTDLFKSLVKGLIMNRLNGVRDKYPSLYLTIDGYATAVSELPYVFTDENPQDVEQVAELFKLRLGELEANIRSVKVALNALETQSREVRL